MGTKILAVDDSAADRMIISSTLSDYDVFTSSPHNELNGLLTALLCEIDRLYS